MIARLDGTVLGAAGTRIVVGVGGLGLAVAVTPQQSLVATIGSPIALHTTLIVREDDMSLYGFGTQAELDAFDLLRGVSGVGPKSALGVLSHMTPDQLADAVEREDERSFKAVSGIGPKTARLIIVQLAGKIHAAAPSAGIPGDAGADVLVALTGLGWPERQARAALEAVGTQADAGSLLRAALAELGPRA